jgi:hypothetical protein
VRHWLNHGDIQIVDDKRILRGFPSGSVRAVTEQIGAAYLIKPFGLSQLDATIAEIRNEARA